MKYENGNAVDLKIAYIGGGSRGWAWGLMSDLAMEPMLSGTVSLYDIDFEAAKSNEIIGNRFSERDDAPGKWKYKAAATLRDALDGADFIVISILPGTFKEMMSDVHEPEKYGIYQPVGDTTGPGGLIRALRTIPMYVEIAEAIRDFAPKAWVINYTNPMSLCVRTLYHVFPEIKAFGCCHEVFGTQNLLALMLKDQCGIDGVRREEINVNVLGINHFTWLDRASYYGMDLFPIYARFAEKYAETGYVEKSDRNWMNSFFASADMVKMDLFRRYGLIAAAGDRHLAEFLPPWYLKDPETVKAWKFNLTPVDFRIKQLEERLAKSARLVSGEEEVVLEPTGEEGVLLIKALLGLGNIVSNVNLPNRGQSPGLPVDSVIETNALFSRDNITPVLAGELPSDINALVVRHCFNMETTLRAALTKNKELAFRAFMNDPLMVIHIDDGKRLFDSMLKNTEAYLPGWNV